MKKVVLVVFILQFVALALYADDYTPMRKLGRGVANFSLAIAEVPRQVDLVRDESGTLAGLTYGTVKGLTFFLGRTVLGVYEAATFLLPTYKPLVEPEFILTDEDEQVISEPE
jgi:putative exosortase-associated protein (TIGR04073 family)